ncbi:hypothetical protein [Stenotrophomonas indicatrix]|uniref:hypothetical protein n=1 Tax=Stenotrophomonas indicatrix TaxID=2045451 RepID=UPI00289F23D1|nr:hypothetical protein [Stenotrophomonas indicatrix]
MSMLDALGQCWWLGDKCIPEWQAWAVAAAVFGGAGSWAAAFVTYWAVILPINRRKWEDHAVASAEMEDFAVELIDLRERMGFVALTLGFVKPDGDAAQTNARVHALTRQVSVPKLQATPETLSLVKGLNRLKREVTQWNETTTTFDLTYDPELGSEFLEYQVANLKSRHATLMKEIRAAAVLIRPFAPEFSADLDRVISSGDGFLPLPDLPDID